MTEFSPRNILLIHFGQMGDVILALPALRAVRARFPDAKITSMTGKSAATIARMAGVFDDEIVVDRVELRDGPKLRSIAAIGRLVKDVRARRFDFVIDLHSLAETNLLGFVSGAKARLYAHRENRSLDFLARFPTPPPREDRSAHVSDRYLDALVPLGIVDAPRFVEIDIEPAAREFVETALTEHGAADARILGLFPGAGHPGRKWPLERFVEVAKRIEKAHPDVRTLVVLGPEERDMVEEVRRVFPPSTIIFDRLTVPQLFATTARTDVMVGNDTGVVHVGATAGANVVLIVDERAPTVFRPLTPKLEVVNPAWTMEIPVEAVEAGVLKFLNA